MASLCCKGRGDVCSPVPFRGRTPLPGVNSLYLYAVDDQVITGGDKVQWTAKAWEVAPGKSFAPTLPTDSIVVPNVECEGVYNITTTVTLQVDASSQHSISIILLLTRDSDSVVIAASSPRNPHSPTVQNYTISLSTATNYFLKAGDEIAVRVNLAGGPSVNTTVLDAPGSVHLSMVQLQVGASSVVPLVPPLP